MLMLFVHSSADTHSALYEYWLSRRGQRQFPSRPDIDPAALKHHLPNLMLIDVEGDAFRYRLVGTQVVVDMGRDPTGTIFGTHSPPGSFIEAILRQLRQVRDTGCVLFSTGFYKSSSDVSHTTARLLLPLGDSHGVRMILQSRTAIYSRTNDGSFDWIARADGRIETASVVRDAEHLKQEVAAWHQAGQSLIGEK